MPKKRTGGTRLGAPTLTAVDWAEAALQLIAEKGLGALTVAALATRLGVTKGSFYWHFKGRSNVLAAALTQWEQRATSEAITGLEAVADPRRRLELMFDASSRPPRSRSLYAALAEAAEDPIVRRVASVRIGYLEACYRDLAFLPRLPDRMRCSHNAAYRGCCSWRTRHRPRSPPTGRPMPMCHAESARP